MHTFVLFFLGCYVLLVRGFLPSKESTGGRDDYTHASITQAAIYHATSDVIANVISPGKYNASDPDGTIMTYFDHDTLIHFAQTIMDIVNKNNLAQRTYSNEAARTMNCEQIEPGHLLLQTLRDNIIHQSQTANPNWDAVRDLIGQYLFTLQEFYSNTNWVEMFGDRVCQELGISGESLPYKVSDPDKVTCTSCNYTKEAVKQYSCVDNMRSDGQLLTSGYTSHQNINKPIGQFPQNMGKCSHGGPYDNSKDIPATGGINKETSSPELSPHFDLHQEAGEAAIQATYDFFVGNGTGLLSVLGIEKFKEIMGMNYKNPCYNCLAPGLSVVFVIDDTGSMSGEIREATQHSIDIVNQAKLLGPNGPSNFILSTFNDPDTSIYNTTDGNEMKQWLHDMVAHGGGDCPEMALTGILNALKIANPGSCVFFFTDADAKDPEKQNDVINMTIAKHIKLVYFLRGDCGGGSRRRRSFFSVPENVMCIPNDNSRRAGRVRRSSAGFDLFGSIAAATGGHVVHTSSSSLGGILGSFVKNNMGASKIGVTSFEMSASTHSISVDSDLSLLTVTIEDLSSATFVSLVRPDGSTQVYSGTASIDKVGSTTVISVQNPPAGEWNLHKRESGTWKVKVGGSGNIDFTYKFMEDVRGIKYPITGTSPITGSKLIISISVTGLPPSAKITHIILKKPNGVILTKLPVSDTSSESNRVLYAFYDVTPEEFFVSINGSIDSKILTREKSDIVKPVTGEITFTSKPENLVRGENSVIDVGIKNTGSTSQTYQLTATSVPSGFPTQRSFPVTVGPKSSKEISLTLTPTNVSVATLSVKLTLGGQTLQTISRTLMVVDLPPPKFSEVNRTSNCRREMLNYYNCTKQNWTIVIDVAFRANLSQLYVTPTSVQLKYARSSPSSYNYVATLSGTCCTYTSQVTAIDARGNIKTKTIDFLGGNVFNTTVENFDILTKPVPVKSDKKHESLVYYIKVLTLAGAGTMVLALVVAIVITSVYIKHKKRNSSNIKPEKTPVMVSLASLNQIQKNRRIVSALDF